VDKTKEDNLPPALETNEEGNHLLMEETIIQQQSEKDGGS